MSFLTEIYQKSLAENEKNIRFWADYLQNLKSLNFNSYSDKLKVPVLVPIGSRILFRGELKHTNEITVALGADYFTKCSIKQGEILRQHRIKDAESKLKTFQMEKQYLENQMSISQQTICNEGGKEIIEVHTEVEDRAWREKHKENVRTWKRKGKEKHTHDETNDVELWERLEELELQEELKQELEKEDDEEQDSDDSFIVKEETILENIIKKGNKEPETDLEKKVRFTEDPMKQSDKLELLQKVIDKQNKLEEKLTELKNKDRSMSKTEQDLIAKLDEMEELEDLQDEMDRLEDMIETQSISTEESEEETFIITEPADFKRRVSFADENDAETIEISFQHSKVEPTTEPYDIKKGITKPCDIYDAYPNLFTAINRSTTTSILKNTKYEDKENNIVLPSAEKIEKKKVKWPVEEANNVIVMKDVIEKVEAHDNKLETEKRPVSLFKQRRQQMNHNKIKQ